MKKPYGAGEDLLADLKEGDTVIYITGSGCRSLAKAKRCTPTRIDVGMHRFRRYDGKMIGVYRRPGRIEPITYPGQEAEVLEEIRIRNVRRRCVKAVEAIVDEVAHMSEDQMKLVFQFSERIRR